MCCTEFERLCATAIRTTRTFGSFTFGIDCGGDLGSLFELFSWTQV